MEENELDGYDLYQYIKLQGWGIYDKGDPIPNHLGSITTRAERMQKSFVKSSEQWKEHQERIQYEKKRIEREAREIARKKRMEEQEKRDAKERKANEAAWRARKRAEEDAREKARVAAERERLKQEYEENQTAWSNAIVDLVSHISELCDLPYFDEECIRNHIFFFESLYAKYLECMDKTHANSMMPINHAKYSSVRKLFSQELLESCPFIITETPDGPIIGNVRYGKKEYDEVVAIINAVNNILGFHDGKDYLYTSVSAPEYNKIKYLFSIALGRFDKAYRDNCLNVVPRIINTSGYILEKAPSYFSYKYEQGRYTILLISMRKEGIYVPTFEEYQEAMKFNLRSVANEVIKRKADLRTNMKFMYDAIAGMLGNGIKIWRDDNEAKI